MKTIKVKKRKIQNFINRLDKIRIERKKEKRRKKIVAKSKKREPVEIKMNTETVPAAPVKQPIVPESSVI